MLLCLIPTALRIIVIATVVGDEEDVGSNFCELEPRTFVNAFTTRCVCTQFGAAAILRYGDYGVSVLKHLPWYM
jgi:hypothetical protein